MNGRIRWDVDHQPPWSGSHPGGLITPTTNQGVGFGLHPMKGEIELAKTATKKRWIHNLYDGTLRIGNTVLQANGHPKSTALLTEDFDDMAIDRLVQKGRIEILDAPINIQVEKTAEIGVVPVQKPQANAIKLETCLGITKKGVQCKNDATSQGPKKAPLCVDHRDQIEDLEFNEKERKWNRKL